MPTNNTPTQQSYPKRHLLAASGIAALLCLVLIVYPSREVEAKKTFITIEAEEQILNVDADEVETVTQISAIVSEQDAPQEFEAQKH